MRTFVCLLLALTATFAAAKPKRSVSAVYFQAPAGAPEKIYARAGKENIEIPLPRMNLSQRIEIPSGELVLGITLQPVAEGETPPANAPLVRIPEAWSDTILLVGTNPKRNEFPVKVVPINISPGVFKPGELLFFNFSSANVAGKIGSKILRIKPATSVQLESPASENSPSYEVDLDYMPAGATEPRGLASTVWRHDPLLRQLLFILDDTERNVPRIWSVSVSPPPVDPEKSGGGAPPPAVP